MSLATNIYFIAPVGGGNIKIGLAKSPHKRLSHLQIGSPVVLELLAAVPGSFDDERKLHCIFLPSHSHGEWFRSSPELLAVIAAAKANGALPEEARAVGHQSPAKLYRRIFRKRSPEICRRISEGVLAANRREAERNWASIRHLYEQDEAA